MAEHLKRVLLLQFVATIALYCSPAIAQTNKQIVLNVTVVTEKGAFTGGLGRDDFSVEVDKLPQDIVSFSDSEVPASVGILIDTSGSSDPGKYHRAGFKQNLKDGLQQFLKLSHPSNEYFVMTFNRSSTLVQDWTSDHAAVLNTMDPLVFEKSTSMYDAIVSAIPKVTSGQHAKQVLMVFSDGFDNQSKTSRSKTLEVLKRSNVIFYGLGALDPAPDRPRHLGEEGAAILEDFARHTGGRVLFATLATTRAAFNEPFEHAARELRSHYQLVISPENPAGKEKWRKLKIKVSKKDSVGKPQKLYAIARQGYYP